MITLAIVLLGLATLTHSFVVWMHAERRYAQGYEDGYSAVRQQNPHGIPPYKEDSGDE